MISDIKSRSSKRLQDRTQDEAIGDAVDELLCNENTNVKSMQKKR
jgi:hypothetical protein